VVRGGGGAGMGGAATTELANLGAEIHVIDLKDPPVPVASHQVVDLRDPDATAAAIENIGGTIHALFNCAGLPGPPFSAVDTMLVNFAAMRHLAELCADRMTEGGAICSISSGAGMGYLQQIEKWMPLMQTEGFAGAKGWGEGDPEGVRAVEGGDHPLDALRGDPVLEARHPRERHQPGADGHADDAGVRGALGQG